MSETKHEERYGAYMTANNAPAPLAASASQSNWGAFRAFSESLEDDITFTGLATGTEQWVQIQLDAPIRIWALRISCRTTVSAKDSGQVPKNFTVQGSEDGTTFEDIQAYTDVAWDQFTTWDAANNQYNWADAKKIEINGQKEYQYYRFVFGECQAISTQKAGAMTPTISNTVKLTLIDLYQVEGTATIPDGLDKYLNTTEDMEVLVNNVKHDDDTVTVTGVDWFSFDGMAATSIYANGNSWIGIGKNSEQLKVCRRDGAMYSLYRQEGMLYNYYKFLKIRWEGYSYYSSTSDTYALKYELFLFDTGDIFLNVIQTPASSSYIGTSSITSGGVTTTLNIPVSSTPVVTLTHQDDTGSLWEASYEEIVILPPYDRKYLIQAGEKYYTIASGQLTEIEVVDLNAQVFKDSGVDVLPGEVLLSLVNPRILYWQDSADPLPEKTVAVQAIPKTQTVYTTEQDLSDPSIVGIKSVAVDASEGVLMAFSSERGSFRILETGAWVDAAEDTGMSKAEVEAVTEEQWVMLMGKDVYQIRFLIPEGTYLNRITVNYKNEGGITA